MNFCRVLPITLAVAAFGQAPTDPYKNVKQALWLTESQLWRLEQNRLAARSTTPRPSSNEPVRAERRTQQGNSSVLVGNELLVPDDLTFLYPSQRDRLTQIRSVLDRWAAASEAIVIGVISERDWPGSTLCYYPVSLYAAEFNLNESQVSQFQKLRDVSWPARPPRESAMAILNNAQKAKVTAFRAELELAEEAIQIGLIPQPLKGEVLCQ